MKAAVKTAWLAELAATTYPPGGGYLAVRPVEGGPTTYSANGVLCELAIRAGVAVRKLERTTPWLPGYFVMTYDGDDVSLPPAVATWAEAPSMLWVHLARPSGIYALSHVGQMNAGSFTLVSALIAEHL